MENIIRLLVGGALGIVVFWIYDATSKRILQACCRSQKLSRERRAYAGISGYFRLSVGCLLALVVLACCLEDSGTPFTAYW